jgi:two-component system alkaline phosphatase synthesis response regulator PhoP
MKRDFEVLVVEDDEDDAESIMLVLKKEISCHIRHIDNGRSALEYLFSDESDNLKLIFLDLVLPYVQGIEILERLKADPIKSAIPVIILSSLRGEEYVKSFNLKADGYFSKYQFLHKSYTELNTLLNHVMEQNSKLSSWTT